MTITIKRGKTKMLSGDKRKHIKFKIKTIRLPIDLAELLEENARLVLSNHPIERDWSFSDSVRYFLGECRANVEKSNRMMTHNIKAAAAARTREASRRERAQQ